jgi:hypothetical protein
MRKYNELLHAFFFFGGIFPVLIYDNLSTAVEKILGGRDGFGERDSVSSRRTRVLSPFTRFGQRPRKE